MKLDLPTIEKTAQLKYRVPVSLKTELDSLNAECTKYQLGFSIALADGLRQVARVLRQQIEEAKSRLTSEPKAEPKVEPKPVLANGSDPEVA